MIQCNTNAIRVTGPAGLGGADIARTSNTNRAGVWICRPTHAKYINDVKPQCVIIKKAVYVVL